MHIPDGYLSPSTCAVLYAASAPFWYVALDRVKRELATRTVPLLSVFSAFSFVVMMFNLPLPGGTTGHAAGIAVAAVVLGPWAAMLAISVALLIQALFFGDGGVLAFGANAFNMGIVGSLVAYAVYRGIAGAAPLASTRRVAAASIAGYAAINAAALVAAVEFGIQPALFRGESGAPLYAPYPLHVAIPAMMIGHLTFAGLAEAIVSGGIVSYLQRGDVSLLAKTAPAGLAASAPADAGRARSAARSLWIGLALLMICTPLGLLTAGTAWGEWAPEDFASAEARAEIEAASGAPAPDAPPSGLERLATFWTAPVPDYAPPYLRSEALGYLCSAMLGTGLIIATFLLASKALGRHAPPSSAALAPTSGRETE